ncbi:MAG: regulatory protein RecX [Bacteroidales bacterium]
MDKKEALSKAMAACARQEHCDNEIRGKMRAWGIDHSDIEEVIEELRKQLFLDDERYARAFVRDKLKLNGWGRIKIRYLLKGKGVESGIIDKALEEIDEEQYTSILKDLLEKKARTLKNEANPRTRRQKLINFALGRGFEYTEVDNVLKDDNFLKS